MFFSSDNWQCLTAARKIIIARVITPSMIVMALTACGAAPSSPELALHEAQNVIKDGSQYIEQKATSGFASFLVAQEAIRDDNTSLAANEFASTLAHNPVNITLMRIAFFAHYINGNIDKAALLSRQIEQRGEVVSFGSEPALVFAMEERDYAGMLVLADHLYADDAARPLSIIAGAWALIMQGQGDAGLTRLLDLETDGEDGAGYAIFSQSALMNEYLGRPEDAVSSALLAIDHPDADSPVIINMAGVLIRQHYHSMAHDILNEKLPQIFNKDKILADVTGRVSPLMEHLRVEDLFAEAIIEATLIRSDNRVSRSARLFLAERIAPDNDRVNYGLGFYHQDSENLDKALRYFNRISPDSLWGQPAQFAIATHMSFEGQNQAAAKDIFENLIAINPSSEVVWKQSADAAFRRGDLDTALSYYERAIMINPNEARYHYLKAIILDELGMKSEIEAALRKSISLDPEYSDALNNLGYWLLEEGGNPNEALGFIKKAIEKEPDVGIFVDSLGWGYYKLGQYKQAILYLERAVNLEPVDPAITDHLGDAYAQEGRKQEAIYQWERALVFDPDDELHAQIMDKLNHGLNGKAPE